MTTSDTALADRARRLRNGGQTERYHHGEFGVNSRLDEMQAAILRARLTFLPAWTARRRALARAVSRGARRPRPRSWCRRKRDAGHVYHLFPVLQRGARRAAGAPAQRGVETLVHYPIPIPRQQALAELRSRGSVRSPIGSDAGGRVAAALPVARGRRGRAVVAAVRTAPGR